MNVNLTKEECQNIVVALITLSKVPDVNRDIMKYLLNLSDKFQWVESPDVEKLEQVNTKLETETKELEKGEVEEEKKTA